MSAPPFALRYTAEAEKILNDLRNTSHQAAKLKKVRKTLRLLEQSGPGHPGLNSHRYQSAQGPRGTPLWESCVENRTASAWRIWWVHGPGEAEIAVVTIGPHP